MFARFNAKLRDLFHMIPDRMWPIYAVYVTMQALDGTAGPLFQPFLRSLVVCDSPPSSGVFVSDGIIPGVVSPPSSITPLKTGDANGAASSATSDSSDPSSTETPSGTAGAPAPPVRNSPPSSESGSQQSGSQQQQQQEVEQAYAKQSATSSTRLTTAVKATPAGEVHEHDNFPGNAEVKSTQPEKKSKRERLHAYKPQLMNVRNVNSQMPELDYKVKTKKDIAVEEETKKENVEEEAKKAIEEQKAIERRAADEAQNKLDEEDKNAGGDETKKGDDKEVKEEDDKAEQKDGEKAPDASTVEAGTKLQGERVATATDESKADESKTDGSKIDESKSYTAKATDQGTTKIETKARDAKVKNFDTKSKNVDSKAESSEKKKYDSEPESAGDSPKSGGKSTDDKSKRADGADASSFMELGSGGEPSLSYPANRETEAVASSSTPSASSTPRTLRRADPSSFTISPSSDREDPSPSDALSFLQDGNVVNDEAKFEAEQEAAKLKVEQKRAQLNAEQKWKSGQQQAATPVAVAKTDDDWTGSYFCEDVDFVIESAQEKKGKLDCLAALCHVLSIPLFGILCDRKGRKYMLLVAIGGFLVYFMILLMVAVFMAPGSPFFMWFRADWNAFKHHVLAQQQKSMVAHSGNSPIDAATTATLGLKSDSKEMVFVDFVQNGFLICAYIVRGFFKTSFIAFNSMIFDCTSLGTERVIVFALLDIMSQTCVLFSQTTSSRLLESDFMNFQTLYGMLIVSYLFVGLGINLKLQETLVKDKRMEKNNSHHGDTLGEELDQFLYDSERAKKKPFNFARDFPLFKIFECSWQMCGFYVKLFWNSNIFIRLWSIQTLFYQLHTCISEVTASYSISVWHWHQGSIEEVSAFLMVVNVMSLCVTPIIIVDSTAKKEKNEKTMNQAGTSNRTLSKSNASRSPSKGSRAFSKGNDTCLNSPSAMLESPNDLGNPPEKTSIAKRNTYTTNYGTTYESSDVGDFSSDYHASQQGGHYNSSESSDESTSDWRGNCKEKYRVGADGKYYLSRHSKLKGSPSQNRSADFGNRGTNLGNGEHYDDDINRVGSASDEDLSIHERFSFLLILGSLVSIASEFFYVLEAPYSGRLYVLMGIVKHSLAFLSSIRTSFIGARIPADKRAMCLSFFSLTAELSQALGCYLYANYLFDPKATGFAAGLPFRFSFIMYLCSDSLYIRNLIYYKDPKRALEIEKSTASSNLDSEKRLGSKELRVTCFGAREVTKSSEEEYFPPIGQWQDKRGPIGQWFHKIFGQHDQMVRVKEVMQTEISNVKLGLMGMQAHFAECVTGRQHTHYGDFDVDHSPQRLLNRTRHSTALSNGRNSVGFDLKSIAKRSSQNNQSYYLHGNTRGTSYDHDPSSRTRPESYHRSIRDGSSEREMGELVDGSNVFLVRNLLEKTLRDHPLVSNSFGRNGERISSSFGRNGERLRYADGDSDTLSLSHPSIRMEPTSKEWQYHTDDESANGTSSGILGFFKNMVGRNQRQPSRS